MMLQEFAEPKNKLEEIWAIKPQPSDFWTFTNETISDNKSCIDSKSYLVLQSKDPCKKQQFSPNIGKSHVNRPECQRSPLGFADNQVSKHEPPKHFLLPVSVHLKLFLSGNREFSKHQHLYKQWQHSIFLSAFGWACSTDWKLPKTNEFGISWCWMGAEPTPKSPDITK